MSGIGFGQNGRETYAGPGHWNDPDMLVVGKVGWRPDLHATRLTPNEQDTHITLWSLLPTPVAFEATSNIDLTPSRSARWFGVVVTVLTVALYACFW